MFEPVISAFKWLYGVIISILLLLLYVITIGKVDYRKPRGVATGGSCTVGGSVQQTYKILTFNVEDGAANFDPARITEIVRATGANVLILTEAWDEDGKTLSPRIIGVLNELAFNYIYSKHNGAIIASKYSVDTIRGYADSAGAVTVGSTVGSYSAEGVKQYVQKPKGRLVSETSNKYYNSAAVINGEFYVIAVHFTDFPYQPFEIHDIEYCYDTCQRNVKTQLHEGNREQIAHRMVTSAEAARGDEVDTLISAVKDIRGGDPVGPVIIAGDFNEPSHYDWTERGTAVGSVPLRVKFPASTKLVSEGITDLFRAVHPDEVREPGHTWPARALSADYLADMSAGQIREQKFVPRDRIDFIYSTCVDKRHCEKQVTPLRAEVIETPSDHNAVLAEIKIE